MDIEGLDKPLRDFVFVRADPTKNAVKEIAPGIDIIIDQTFEKHSMTHVTQDGIIEYLPRGLTQMHQDDINYQGMELEIGDHVYGHHFLCNKHVRTTKIDSNGDGLYYILYGELYCKVKDGDITMIGEWNLVDPVKVPALKSSIPNLITQVKEHMEPLKGVATHINERLRTLGVNEGDEIIFDADSDYEMMIEGKMYYRMENTYILGKSNDKWERTQSASGTPSRPSR